MNERVSFKAVFKEKEFWFLILIGILYFYRPLLLGETFYFRDLGLYTLPQKRLLVEFIQAKELPLWDVYRHGGQPYLASLNHFPLYPFNLLYIVLPLFSAFNLTLISHVMLCLACAYLFARILGFSPVSSFIAAILYGFCGYSLSLINMAVIFLAMPYLPLLFLFWHLFLLERKPKWFVLTALVGILRVLAGAPEANVMGMVVLLGWSLCFPYPSMSSLRKIWYWGLLGIFILGLTSMQLFPTMEMVLQSARGTGFDYTAFSGWSLHPIRILEMLFPQLFGHVNSLQWNVNYWGGALVDGGVPYILSIYFGSVAIILAVLGGVYSGNSSALPVKMRRYLLAIVISSLLLSLGRYFPFFYLLYKYIPLITIVRYPIKFFMAALLPFALLAGYGSSVLFGKTSSAEKGEAFPIIQRTTQGAIPKPSVSPWFLSSKILVALWCISFVFLLFITMFWLSTGFPIRVQQLLFQRIGGDIVRRGMASSFAHAFGVWLVFMLLYQYRKLKQQSWQHWIIAVLLTIDLLSAGSEVNHFAIEKFFTDVPLATQKVRSEIGEGRLFRAANLQTTDIQQYTLNFPSYDVIWLHRWDLEMLKSYLAVFYQIPVIFHGDLDSMASRRLMQLKALIDSLPWERRLPLLSIGGVSVILTAEALSVPGMPLLAEIPNRSSVPLYLYRNETAAARIECVTSWEEVHSDNEAFAAMLRPNYDPRTQVILQKPEPSLFESYPAISVEPPHSSRDNDCEPANITKITSKNHSAVFAISNKCDGYLVFSEPYYPGWRIAVDGEQTPILRANYAFSAIFLPAGDHEVIRYYCPNSLIYGIVTSLMFCGILGIIGWKGWLL